MLIQLSMFVAATVGIMVVWANPRRLPNQAFGVLTFLALGFLWLVYQGGSTTDPLSVRFPYPWHRANAAWATLMPGALWLIRESLLRPEATRLALLRTMLPWLLFSAAWASLCLLDTFIIVDDEHGRTRGVAYWVYTLIGFATYTFLVGSMLREVRRTRGIKRIEFQFLALNIGVAVFLSVLITSLNNYFRFQSPRRLLFLVIIGSFSLVGWAIAVQRIFAPRHIFLAIIHSAVFAFLIGLGGYVQWSLHAQPTAVWIDLVAGCFFLGATLLWLNEKTREWLGLGERTALAELRGKLIELARTEPDAERLVERSETLLIQECQITFTALLFNTGDLHRGSNLSLSKNTAGYPFLCENGWATPESLQRRRTTFATTDLKQFLADHSLGLIVTAPRGSPTPSLIVAFGSKTNEWPFTYPEVQRLQNIAELMDNILTHSRLTAQAALQAKIEHLAMMSRGLAHDLKNLITPVSSFLIHTDGHYTPDSPEAEVHTAARRSVRIMTDYVREALFFSERLQPKLESIDLNKVLDAVRDVTAARASTRGISVAVHNDFSGSLVADRVLLQRLLANLVNNAIDASAHGQTVTVSADAANQGGWLRIVVADNGCGIAPENLNRIFEPYFTTKEFGDDVRGFGLGLTICQKITNLHGGTIGVRSELGHGTRITVEFPTQPAPRGLLPAPPCLALP